MTSGHDNVLQSWWRDLGIKRFLMPSDLVENAKINAAESFSITKRTERFLERRDRENNVTMKNSEASGMMRDLQYLPAGFKNETVKIMAAASRENCPRCSGRGRIDCPVTETCPDCRGRRIVEIGCDTCEGSGNVYDIADILGQNPERCRSCAGNGRFEQPCRRCYRSAATNQQTAQVVVNVGGSPRRSRQGGPTGQVRCSKCEGTGYVRCPACDAQGNVIQGRVIQRRFTAKTRTEWEISGKSAAQVRQAVNRKAFQKVRPCHINDSGEYPATDGNIVRRQDITETWDVERFSYEYNGTRFSVNVITGDNGVVKYDSRPTPYSTLRVTLAGLGVVLAVGIVSTFIALGAL